MTDDQTAGCPAGSAPQASRDRACALRIRSAPAAALEFELLRVRYFDTLEQARRAVAAWIDEYNSVRRHSTDRMLAPIDYELAQARTRRDAA